MAEFHAALLDELNRTWGSHNVVGPSLLNLTAASPGRFERTDSCRTPLLWIFLTGQFRTFLSTAATLERTASLASAGCYMVAALVPDDEALVPDVGSLFVPRHAAAPSNASLSALLLHAQERIFAGRLAFALVSRDAGSVRHYPGCLSLYWHGTWLVARWAATVLGLQPDPHAVVLRTRTDLMPRLVFGALRALRASFALERGGRHAAFGGESLEFQGDLGLVTSFQGYESGIALPIEQSGRLKPLDAARALWDRAHLNGWAYGRSLVNLPSWWQLETPSGCAQRCVRLLPPGDGRGVRFFSCLFSMYELPSAPSGFQRFETSSTLPIDQGPRKQRTFAPVQLSQPPTINITIAGARTMCPNADALRPNSTLSKQPPHELAVRRGSGFGNFVLDYWLLPKGAVTSCESDEAASGRTLLANAVDSCTPRRFLFSSMAGEASLCGATCRGKPHMRRQYCEFVQERTPEERARHAFPDLPLKFNAKYLRDGCKKDPACCRGDASGAPGMELQGVHDFWQQFFLAEIRKKRNASAARRAAGNKNASPQRSGGRGGGCRKGLGGGRDGN